MIETDGLESVQSKCRLKGNWKVSFADDFQIIVDECFDDPRLQTMFKSIRNPRQGNRWMIVVATLLPCATFFWATLGSDICREAGVTEAVLQFLGL